MNNTGEFTLEQAQKMIDEKYPNDPNVFINENSKNYIFARKFNENKIIEETYVSKKTCKIICSYAV